MTTFFERASSPDAYAQSLAHAYFAGYRIYDPSIAAQKDPESERKMMRWPPFLTQFQIRHHSIVGRKWGVTPTEDSGDRGKGIATIGRHLLSHIDGFTQAKLNLAKADVSGARFAERCRKVITARYGDGKPRRWVVPVRLKDMAKENFRWDPVVDPSGEEKRARAKLRYARKSGGTVAWVDVPEYAPLLRHIIGDSEDTLGYGRGLRDALIFLFNAQTRIFQADVQAAERMGHGWLVMKLDDKAAGSPTVTNTTLVNKAQTALNKMRAKHNFIIGTGDEIEFLAPPAQAADFMGKLAERLERMSDRLISGGTMFSGGNTDTGGYSQAETEADTSSLVFDTMSDLLEETITRDLLVPSLRDNYGNLVELGLVENGESVAEIPHGAYEVVRGRKETKKETAEWIAAAVGAGVPMKVQQACDLLEIEKPGEDDEILKAPHAGGFDFGAALASPNRDDAA